MENFLKNLLEQISLNGNNDQFTITLPFKLFNDEQSSFSIILNKHIDGYYLVNDHGYTLKHLKNLDVNLSSYEEQIEIICSLYSIKIEDGLVKGIVGYGTNQLYIQLFNYLQAISHLSTLKFLY